MAQPANSHAKEVVRILLFAVFGVLAVQSAAGQHYPILPVPNSPHNIFTLMQDRESRLWAGTMDDVYMFDGERFYSLRPLGFPRETANTFAEDDEGGVWIGTQGTDAMGGSAKGGLYRYQDGHVQKLFSGDVLGIVDAGLDVMLASFATEISGGPAFGDLYLFRHEGRAWRAEKLLDRAVNHMTVDHQGTVLFPCPGGWCEIQKSVIAERLRHSMPVVPIRHQGDRLVERVLRDQFGCVWFRAEPYASYQCPGDPAPLRVPASVSGMDPSDHLEETTTGSIFMLVRLALGRPGHFYTANFRNGMPAQLGTAIVAKDGTIWMGAEDGLYRFMYPFRLAFWEFANGIDSAEYLAKLDGTIFAAGRGIATFSADRNVWTPVPGLEGQACCLLAGTDHDLLAVRQNQIQELAGGRVPVATSPLAKSLVIQLAGAPDGRIWLGNEGIFRVTRRERQLIIQAEQLPPSPPAETGIWTRAIGDMKYDAVSRTLWACYGKNLLFKNDDDGWHEISRDDGLLDQRCISIAPQIDGSVWMGYNSPSFALISNPTSGHPHIQNFNNGSEEPAADNSIRFFTTDLRGWLWRGGAGDGIYVATRRTAETGIWLRLNPQDGFTTETYGRPFLTDPDGSVWFGRPTGVGHFSPPDGFAITFPAPAVFVSGFSVGSGSPQLAGMPGELPRAVPILAHVGSLQFDRRNVLEIRYRFLPGQRSWTTTQNLTIQLGKPSWGKHMLEVQARLSTGPWSSIVAQSFTVATPVLLKWPALSGFALAGIALGTGTAQWRRRQRRLQQKLSKAFPDLAEWRLAALSPEVQQLDGAPLDGRFDVGRVLARGGFAAVAEGRDLADNGRRCAIKIFRQEVANRDWIERRFQQEVRALSQLRHPNVVRIVGSGILPQGTMYLAMEFIEGSTLRELLGLGKVPPSQVALYLEQIGSALDAIHACGICHRDLKPENLMLRASADPGAEMVLIDFSIAIVKDPDETVHGLSRAAGTISYMAPEQAIGYADPSTDIYSLAKVVIEMLTGERLSALLPDASMDLPERSRELLTGLGVPLSTQSLDLLSAALQFDPARRPKQAGQFASQIAADLSGGV